MLYFIAVICAYKVYKNMSQEKKHTPSQSKFINQVFSNQKRHRIIPHSYILKN